MGVKIYYNENVAVNITGKEDSNVTSSEGEEGQERTPEFPTHEEFLENFICLCYVTRAEDKLKIRLAADVGLIYHYLPFQYYIK